MSNTFLSFPQRHTWLEPAHRTNGCIWVERAARGNYTCVVCGTPAFCPECVRLILPGGQVTSCLLHHKETEMTKQRSVLQTTKQQVDHRLYGCTWKPALARGVSYCTCPDCGQQAFCPLCCPEQQPVPGKISIRYCTLHGKEEAR